MKIYTLQMVLLLYFLVTLPACNDRAAWKAEGDGLISQATILQQQHDVLNVRIDSLWDTTTAALAAAIPDDFPPTDREIFLHARNADHIRMFMSFKTLDAATQALVDSAGRYDEMIAGQLRTLQQQRQAFEKQKLAFLQKMAGTAPEDFRYYAHQFHMMADSAPK
ncbi:MAG TPA: hypothetical protein VLA46_13180 [Saprospiraceae bacterium]|nr:hypothetical protein [Saprospiraceae bacterium]